MTSRPNFYDVDTTYDLDDIDGDGVANDDDAAPFDPLDGIDSDEDGFADQVDVFPNDSTEWEDLDGDGIGDNADPEISRFVGLAELTSESVASGSIQQAEPFTWIRTAKSSMDNPDFDPWAGSAAVNFYPNGVYEVPDRSSILGTWTLNGDVIEVSFEPRLDYRSLDESTPELFDLDAWDEAGRPRFEVEEISSEEYRLIEKNETGWLVAWRYQSAVYVTGFEDPAFEENTGYTVSDFVLDPSQPIQTSDNTYSTIVIPSETSLPMTADDVVGIWAMNDISLVDSRCLSEFSTCSQLIRFNADGTGSVGVEDSALSAHLPMLPLTWVVTPDGSIAVDIDGGQGRSLITRYRDYGDGTMAVLADSSSEHGRVVRYGMAVRRGAERAGDLFLPNRFKDVYWNSSAVTLDALSPKREDGLPSARDLWVRLGFRWASR